MGEAVKRSRGRRRETKAATFVAPKTTRKARREVRREGFSVCVIGSAKNTADITPRGK